TRGDGYHPGLHLALGERGWIMPHWPVEDGGAGMDRLGQFLLAKELQRANAPGAQLGTVRLIVTAIQAFGQDAIRDDILRGVARGEIRLALGYTEPHGGSDIASARTRAVRDGDEWVITG